MKGVPNVLIVVLTLIFYHYPAFTQNVPIDTSIYYTWPKLNYPTISPDGKFCTYNIENEKTGISVLKVKSLNDSWERQFQYKIRHFDGLYTHDKLIFSTDGDTIVVITLGRDVEHFSGCSGFKVSPARGNIFAIAQGKKLMIYNDNKRLIYNNVIDYQFVMDGSGILLHFASTSTTGLEEMLLIDLKTTHESRVWAGFKAGAIVLNSDSRQVAFLSYDSTKEKSTGKIELINLKTKARAINFNRDYPDMYISNLISFTKEDVLIARLVEREPLVDSLEKISLRIWSYTDGVPKSEENDVRAAKNYYCSASLLRGHVIKLVTENDEWFYCGPPKAWGKVCLVGQSMGECSFKEQSWNPSCQRLYFLVNVESGVRTAVPALNGRDTRNVYSLDPSCKYIVFFDRASESYYSYQIESGQIVELTKGDVKSHFNGTNTNDEGYLKFNQRGIAGWSLDREYVYIYDFFDIWQFHLRGKQNPQNLTNPSRQEQGIAYSFFDEIGRNKFANSETIPLSFFDTKTKNNGYCKLQSRGKLTPLSGGPYITYIPFYRNSESGGMRPIKATEASKYLVYRESSNQAPNYFVTDDLQNFRNVTGLAPQGNYKWYITELHSWALPDGKQLQGILYKPSDFDSTKKYPVIFNIYEQLSNGLNAFLPAIPVCNGCNVNPLIFTSKEYLIFKPDIFYKANKSGESALAAVSSAVDYLKKYTWVDTGRLGLQGCSFGGFETNYIISHSNLFKAACTASGASDIMSMASQRYRLMYTNFNYLQYRITSNLWDDPGPILENSPIFNVKRITTPLLIFHTTQDDAVPFTQGVQLFLFMRRLNKPVWLLEYGGSAYHGVFDHDQAKDFGLRLTQFFDFFLKNQPPPSWLELR